MAALMRRMTRMGKTWALKIESLLKEADAKIEEYRLEKEANKPVLVRR